MSETVIKHFIFSLTQMKNLKEVELKLGRKYVAPTVIVGGAPQPYTSIVEDVKSVLYSDAKIVASGYLDKMRYTK